MKYAAQAYVGLAWLSNLGLFDTQGEAMDALAYELDRQFGLMQGNGETDEEIDSFSETYWACSQVTEVDE